MSLLPASLRRITPIALGPILLALGLVPTARAQTGANSPEAATNLTAPQETKHTTLAGFIDRLPDLLDFGLPSFAPPGAIRLFAHPKFGDLLHEDYFRIPVGARIKLDENLELNTELGGYFSHGLGESVGNGLYQLSIGLQREEIVSPDLAWSYGLQWVTPLSRPPIEITDGLRHTIPGVTVTKTLLARCGLVGFATLSGDFLDHTSLVPNFRMNELRDNSLVLTLGVVREWRRMHVILRVFDGNTALVSRLSQNAFGVRPGLGIPLLRRADGTPRATATFEGRAIWGPDGFEKGINTSIRVDLRYRRGRKEP